ncbi:MAG: OmpA family protein [Siphonobacter sp.]
MKKRLFLCLIGLWSGLATYAQVTINPVVDEQSTEDVIITKVELTKTYTAIYMVCEQPPLTAQERWLRKMYPQTSTQSTIAIEPESSLRANYKGQLESFHFLRATGIPTRPNKRNMNPGDKVSFVVYYEPLKPGMEKFDFFECRTDNTWQCWNFFGVHIKNPAPDKKKTLKAPRVPNAPANPKKPVEPPTLLVSGQVFDAVTKESIEAKVAIRSAGNKLDSARTVGATGVFRKNLPEGTYQLTVSANGYESSSESVSVNGQVERDFYLQPLNRKPAPVMPPTPPVEEPAPEPKTEPKIEDLKPEVGNKIELKNILFETGKADLLTESRVDLEEVVKWLEKNPTVEIRLEGHTDKIGDSEKNMELSIDRVTAVKRYLVSKGIDPKRIQTKGYGDTRPVTDGRSQEERRLNRRVEMVITKN